MKHDVDISYLKRLVNELEVELKIADSEANSSSSKEEVKAFNQERLVALNRSIGICMGIALEGTMLTSDIQKAITAAFGAPKPSKEDLLENTLTGFLKPTKIKN